MSNTQSLNKLMQFSFQSLQAPAFCQFWCEVQKIISLVILLKPHFPQYGLNGTDFHKSELFMHPFISIIVLYLEFSEPQS